jgi:hypothetical protein
MMYAFHDTSSVSVDGLLYDVLTYGQGDHGMGKDLYREIHKALNNAGYYLEATGGGVFEFVPN